MAKRKNKKKNKKKRQGPPKRPEKFNDPVECLNWIKRSVYSIARGRKAKIDGKMQTQWTTLGSGFIVAPNKLLTAGHVINNEKDSHKDGDRYYLLRHDDNDNCHAYILEPRLQKEIFLYPDVDLSIVYIKDDFYQAKGKIFVNKNDFIRISKDFYPIGSPIGILGYPLCKLSFQDGDIRKPLIGDMLLRTDMGVVNCRYRDIKKKYCYEFTLSFNPGNSGGPIFDLRTGKLISIVKGYKAIPIQNKENIITEEKRKELKAYKEKSFIDTVYATYSVGFATPSILEPLREHDIIN